MAKGMRWGICSCGKWGEAPAGFNELKHGLICPCGQQMYLHRSNPKEAGYRDSAKVMTEAIVLASGKQYEA